MAKFNTGQSFADGDTVTGAKLNNITSQLNIYTGVISEQTAMVATVSTADQLLIADTDNGDSGAANRITVQKLFSDSLTNGTFASVNLTGTITSNRTVATSATITTGTIPNLTAGTTTSTAATITTALIPTLTAGTTTGTAGIFTSGTVATLNSTIGTITNLSTTLAGDFTISQGTGTLGTSGATLGTYGGSTSVPVLAINAKGQVTSTGTAAISSGLTGFRNRIINGDMRIDQRNAGASITQTTANDFVVDRWSVTGSVASKFSAQRNAGAITPPSGYTNYLGITSLSSYSVLSGDYFRIMQPIEGFNVSDFSFGTASALSITLSFWVRASITGTYGGAISNASQARGYAFTYSVSSSNTWEQKTITIPGDTSGTWSTDNGVGIYLIIGLGAGSTFSATGGSWVTQNFVNTATGAVSVVGTNTATFYITGVQLEAGSTATDFERRPIGTELALCQRYLPAFTAISGATGPLPGCATALGTNCVLIFNHPVPARVPGTGVAYSANTHFNFSNNDGNSASTAVSFAASSPNATQISITVASTRGATTTPGWFFANTASAILYVTGCEL